MKLASLLHMCCIYWLEILNHRLGTCLFYLQILCRVLAGGEASNYVI